MKLLRLLLILVLLLTLAVEGNAEDSDVAGTDSVGPDGKPLHRMQQTIKYTIRGFDRLEDE